MVLHIGEPFLRKHFFGRVSKSLSFACIPVLAFAGGQGGRPNGRKNLPLLRYHSSHPVAKRLQLEPFWPIISSGIGK